ncbi:hypothetical protein ACFWDQ_34350 [Streptomyces sp. NPDC060053]|uniref:hypothetical protein n=1 Tax=Streptomyces sp. NPDC060053 TaxID=3347047 RepID=UPI0036B2E3B8
MSHFPSKRLPRPGVVLAAVAGLLAALGLGAAGQAKAAGEPGTAAVTPAFSASPWTDRAHGFASLAGGTTGGAGGEVVTVADQASLARYAAAEEPYVIRVEGAVAVPALVTRFSGPQKRIGAPPRLRTGTTH